MEKAGERFLEHEISDCHKHYKKLLDMSDDEADVGEQMSDSLVNEKAKNSVNVFDDYPEYTISCKTRT